MIYCTNTDMNVIKRAHWNGSHEKVRGHSLKNRIIDMIYCTNTDMNVIKRGGEHKELVHTLNTSFVVFLKMLSCQTSTAVTMAIGKTKMTTSSIVFTTGIIHCKNQIF
jgi:hypothetical protein